MESLADHALLAVGVAALAGAALRAASALTPRGLERAVAAAPIAVTAAVVWALALGLVELGTDRFALAAAAVATWLAARRLLPRPDTGIASELAAWWGGLGPGGRAAAGAAAGVLAAYAVFVVRHPALGIDAVTNHLADVAVWVANGRPGSVVDLQYGLPFGNYPQATETVMTWGSALSRSFVWAGLWSLATLLLLVTAGWVGLRAIGAGRAVTGLGLAALCTSPLIVDAARRPGTDLPALAWLVTAGALVAASVRRPALMAPALLAAGLGIGTKTTVAPLGVAVLVAGAVVHRERLREHARLLGFAALAAAVVGGTWYVRNWIGRGSPLWPLVSLPGSDPLPPLIDALDYSVLDRPGDTLGGRLDVYERRLAGYLILFAAALLAPLVVRRRAVVIGAGATAASLLLWLNAPFTGVGDLTIEGPFLSAVRYLLPVAAAAVVCLVVAAERGGQAGRIFGLAALGAATVWNLVRTLDLGFPVTPSAGTLVLGAIAGALAASATLLVRASPRGVRVAACAVALVAVIAAAVGTDGYAERHGRVNAGNPRVPFAEVVRTLAAVPAFRDGSEPVALAPAMNALLAGDTLDHELELIPPDEPCPEVEQRAVEGWVVIADVENEVVPPSSATTCFRRERPVFESGVYRVYRTG